MVFDHDVHVGADLKERALMNNTESDLFVHGLRSLMTQIGKTESEQLFPKIKAPQV